MSFGEEGSVLPVPRGRITRISCDTNWEILLWTVAEMGGVIDDV